MIWELARQKGVDKVGFRAALPWRSRQGR